MGKYTTVTIDTENYHKLIKTLRKGYTDLDGVIHRPNNQIATILVLEANLGCRIGDIIKLETDSIIWDGDVWRFNITEQKTGKKRSFVVPAQIKYFIDNYAAANDITEGRLFKVSAQAVWKCLRAVTAYLGLKDISSHSFRKRCACDLYAASNNDIELVATFLNHSSVNTTRAYLRRSSKQMEDAINKIVSLA